MTAPPDHEVSWYHRPVPLLLLVFLVLGPLGLPLVWKSPCFSRFWKIVVSVAVTVYTVMLVESMVVAVRMAMDEMGAIAR